jgi:hypothetical protein
MAGTGSRTLKLSILADVADLNKNLTSASKDVDSFGDKVGKVGAAVGAAFVAAAAAAGAYAVKIGVDAVNAAIADEKAQTQLATAIKAATGATDAQIASIEKQILKTSLATGVADDQLRPALSRLVLSTNDTKAATDLLNLALDTSAATGKPLETVTNALAKAYDGNTTALAKLGVGYSAAELKGKDFNTIAGELSDLFGGAAATNAGTYEGQIAKIKVAFDEAKESLGVALLPIVEKFIGFLSETALPVVNKLVDAFGNKENGLNSYITTVGNTIKTVFQPILEGAKSAFDSIKTAIDNNKEAFLAFGQLISTYVAPVIGTVLGAALKVVGTIAGGVIDVVGKVAGAIVAVVNGAISAVNALISAYNSIPILPNVPTIPKVSAPTITIPKVGTTSTTSTTLPSITVPSATGGTATGGGGGVKSATSSAASAAAATSNVVTGSFGAGSFRAAEAASMVTNNITVVGALDKEGTARTIVETLNNSTYRGGGGGAGARIA